MKFKKIFIILFTLICLTGCGSTKLKSKCYTFGNEGDSGFASIECDNKNKICKMNFYVENYGSSDELKYEYSFTKKQNDNTYIIDFTNLKNPDDIYTLIYDPQADTLLDYKTNIVYKSNEIIGDMEKYEYLYNEIKDFENGLSLNYINEKNYESIKYDKDSNKIVIQYSKTFDDIETLFIELNVDYKKGFSSNEVIIQHISDQNPDNIYAISYSHFNIKERFEKNKIDLKSSNLNFYSIQTNKDKEITFLENNINEFFTNTDKYLKKQFDISLFELGFTKDK